jgi:hypothetical protein
MNKLAVVLPSRGLMFSETLEELLGELEGFDYEIFWSHGNSLPDCFNLPTERALADPDVFAVLFCEDDMIIPKGVLKEMFNENYPVVALDYPFKKNGDSTLHHDPEGFAYYSGTGFLLVAKAVLESMEKPIWRTDTIFDPFIDTDTIHFWPRKLEETFYGLHDLYFGMILYSSGLPVKPLERTAGQRKLKKLGKKGKNNGAHDIYELTEVGRDMVIRDIDDRTARAFLGARNRVKNVKIWTEKPPFISYTPEGHMYLNDGRQDKVEYV